MTVAEVRAGPRAAIALYVALAVHVLLLLALALSPAPQDSPGQGIGLSVAGEGLDEQDRRLASTPPIMPVVDEVAAETPAIMPSTPDTHHERGHVDVGAPRQPLDDRATRRAAHQGGGGSASYFARLRAHLTTFRRELPSEWRGARAQVAVELGSSGEVTALELVGSSGRPAFDAEALALVRRASPMPAPPERRAMRVVIPIEIDARN